MANLQDDPIINVIHRSIRRGIDIALQNRCFGAAVVLILSGIDAMAYLAMPSARDDVTRQDFVDWAERYIKFPGAEQLTGMDLYGARCAMLHSYGSQSRMSREGKCRMVGYMDDADPPIRFDPKVSKDLVLVSITALKNAFFEGIDRFLVDTYRTPGSEKARLADERFQKLVHEFPADEV